MEHISHKFIPPGIISINRKELTLFLNEEKILNRIYQDRSRGDLEKARRNAQRGYDKWPDNFDISMELIQLCFDLSDYHGAVKLLKSIVRKNPGKKMEILQFSQETFYQTSNPFLGSFILEALIRNKDLERTSDFLGRASEEYITDLVTRSKTKSKGFIDTGNTNTPQFTDNELLLGLLFIEKRRFEDALIPMLNALNNSPEHAKIIGGAMLNIQRELPSSALMEYILGLASMLLGHPDKAEKRFFKSLEFENPQFEKILDLVRETDKKSENHLLLGGEILFRLGMEKDGAESVKQYLMEENDWEQETEGNKIKQLFPGHIGRKNLVVDRLSNLLGENHEIPDATFLLCDVFSDLNRYNDAVNSLEKLAEAAPDNIPRIISWINKNDEALQTAPAQRLLAILNTNIENYEAAQEAYNIASEMDPALNPELIRHAEDCIEQKGENKTLLKILTGLFAKSSNSERAEELLKKLKEEHSLNSTEALEMTTAVIQNCGATQDNILSALEISIKNNDVSESLPHIIKFYRETPEKHFDFASELRKLAGDNGPIWSFLSKMLDAMKEKVDLSKPFQLLHAHSYLHSGKIEKAVFACDQLMMFDEDIRLDVIAEYEKVVNDHLDNTTLLLALYQLHLDEEQLALASHFLGKALESDQSQIKDVISRFNKIVDRDPSNKEIWEEFLRSSIAINHTNLAQEILSRAISTLDREEAAALHIYGAKISRENNKIEDSLKCLAMTLTSNNPNLRSIEKELDEITRIYPGNSEAIYLKSETYLRLGVEEKAIENFKECIELSPKYNSKIIERLETALPVSAKPWLINNLLGSIAWKQNRREEALALLSKSQKGPVDSIKPLGLELEKYLTASAGDCRLRKLYAENLRLEKKYSEAADEIEILLSENEDYVPEAIAFLTLITEEKSLQFSANRLLAKILIESGKPSESLIPVINMLSSNDAEPENIEESANNFYEIHQENNRFLIAYAHIKALVNKKSVALDFYRSALEKDSGNCKEILAGLREHQWPSDLTVKSETLTADCHIAAGEYEWAFKSLQNLATQENRVPAEIISKINSLISNQPKTEYFLFALEIYAENHNFDEADKLIDSGVSVLSNGDIVELKIQLAGLADKNGLKKRASRLYSEILEETDNKQSILKQMEKSISWMADKRLSDGIAKAENELIGEEEAISLVNTALDYGKLETALKIVTGSDLSQTIRLFLLGRIYLSAERPVLALSLLSSISEETSFPAGRRAQILYTQGAASEILYDYGRAATYFMKILEIHGEYLDTRTRAEANYSKFIDSEIGNKTMILEKTGNL